MYRFGNHITPYRHQCVIYTNTAAPRAGFGIFPQAFFVIKHIFCIICIYIYVLARVDNDVVAALLYCRPL